MTSRLYSRARRFAPLRRNGPDLRGDAQVSQDRPLLRMSTAEIRRPLQVMKFGGTSVADAGCIRNVVEIVAKAAAANSVVVVVSAMGGVTNKLVEAGVRAQAGDGSSMTAILDGLRRQHLAAAEALIPAGARRELVTRKIDDLFEHGDRLCQGTMLLRELTLRARDAIWSLGERLNAPIVAAALAESGVASEAVEATQVIVTSPHHGEADPLMDLTRESCEARLRPLLDRDIVPVTTGFIGASIEGVLTTLGRGGSDYSATIIGAALHADEVIIWTDVDGVLTADPNQVRGARSIPEMSYREAAELAHFGAKVLHPKTLRALRQCGFPLWVRNTFAPARPGTKITPKGAAKSAGLKAITASSDVGMISVGGPCIANVHDVVGRTFAMTAAIRADVLLTSHSSSQSDICLIVSSAHVGRTVESLRDEFAQELAQEKVEHIRVDAGVAIVTLIGQDLGAMSGMMGRACGALGRAGVNMIASTQGPSECNISFVVTRKDVKAALVAMHREFKLGTAEAPRRLGKKF